LSGATTTGAGGGGRWRLWGAIAAIVAATVFILQNSQEVEVNFFLWDIRGPLIFALLFAGLLGLIIGLLAPRYRRGAPRAGAGKTG
jgi:uncharacterized integral membrane protein